MNIINFTQKDEQIDLVMLSENKKEDLINSVLFLLL